MRSIILALVATFFLHTSAMSNEARFVPVAIPTITDWQSLERFRVERFRVYEERQRDAWREYEETIHPALRSAEAERVLALRVLLERDRATYLEYLLANELNERERARQLVQASRPLQEFLNTTIRLSERYQETQRAAFAAYTTLNREAYATYTAEESAARTALLAQQRR